MSKLFFGVLTIVLFYHFALVECGQNITCDPIINSICSELPTCKFENGFIKKYNECEIKVQYRTLMPANGKLAMSFKLNGLDDANRHTILLPKEFDLKNANEWGKFDGNKKFKDGVFNGEGLFLEDYMGFWILKIFYDQSELPSVVYVDPNCTVSDDTTTQTEEQTTTTPIVTDTSSPSTAVTLSTSPGATKPPPFGDCSEPSWVRVMVAAVTEYYDKDNPRIPQDYAARVGFITAATEKKFNETELKEKIKELIPKSIAFAKKDGLEKEVQKWTDNNQWIVDIKRGLFQYAPVSKAELDLDGNGKMAMMMLHKCNFGEFLMAPVKLREGLTDRKRKLFDWSGDFYPLEKCKFSRYDLATQKDYFDRISYLDDPIHFDVQISVGSEITDTNSEPVVLTQAMCEAFMYKYGYENVMRKPEFDDTANDFKRVNDLGYYLLPADHACKPMRQYDLYVDMIVVNSNLMIRKNWAERVLNDGKPDPDRECNLDGICIKCKIVDCTLDKGIQNKILQPVYDCPGFKYWVPRVSGEVAFSIEHLNGDKENINYANAISKITLNGGPHNHHTYEIQGRGNYKLYEGKTEVKIWGKI